MSAMLGNASFVFSIPALIAFISFKSSDRTRIPDRSLGGSGDAAEGFFANHVCNVGKRIFRLLDTSLDRFHFVQVFRSDADPGPVLRRKRRRGGRLLCEPCLQCWETHLSSSRYQP